MSSGAGTKPVTRYCRSYFSAASVSASLGTATDVTTLGLFQAHSHSCFVLLSEPTTSTSNTSFGFALRLNRRMPRCRSTSYPSVSFSQWLSSASCFLLYSSVHAARKASAALDRSSTLGASSFSLPCGSAANGSAAARHASAATLPARRDTFAREQFVRRLPARQLLQALQPPGHRRILLWNVVAALLRRKIQVAAHRHVRDGRLRTDDVVAFLQVSLGDAVGIVDAAAQPLLHGRIRRDGRE